MQMTISFKGSIHYLWLESGVGDGAQMYGIEWKLAEYAHFYASDTFCGCLWLFM